MQQDEEWHADALRTFDGFGTVEETLDQAATLALEAVPAGTSASVSLISRDTITTTTATDDLSRRADELQTELSEGPMLAAIGRQVVVYLDDLKDEQRWPRWSQLVVSDLGLQSMLSFQLFTGESILGALNIYADRPSAFDLDAVNSGYLHAAHVGVTVSNIRQQQNLRSAIASRTIIGQAEGILMERFGLDGTAAFNTLRRLSQARNVKLREVATELVDTGELEGLQVPDQG